MTALLVPYPEPTHPLPVTLFPYTTLFRSRHVFVHVDHIQRRVYRMRSDKDLMGYQPAESRVGIGDQRAHRCRLGSRDRKSTRLNSSHITSSYAVFCLKKEIKVEISRDWMI